MIPLLAILAVVVVSILMLAAASQLVELGHTDLGALMAVGSILLPIVLVLYLKAVYPS